MTKEGQPIANLLLVEDDENLGFLTKSFLESEGFQISWAKNGSEASVKIATISFDLFLLDVMLPDTDGFSLAQLIRQKDTKTPIIFLTARSLKEDKLKGFGLGADDYVTKPFDEDELVCRIRARLKTETPTVSVNAETFNFNGISFTPKQLLLEIGGDKKRLTDKENRILELLCLSANEVVRRETILVDVWGENDYFLGRSLDVFITRLRKYLSASTLTIENIHGVGFSLNTIKK